VPDSRTTRRAHSARLKYFCPVRPQPCAQLSLPPARSSPTLSVASLAVARTAAQPAAEVRQTISNLAVAGFNRRQYIHSGNCGHGVGFDPAARSQQSPWALRIPVPTSMGTPSSRLRVCQDAHPRRIASHHPSYLTNASKANTYLPPSPRTSPCGQGTVGPVERSFNSYRLVDSRRTNFPPSHSTAPHILRTYIARKTSGSR